MGNWTRDGRYRIEKVNNCGRLARKGSIYKRWRPVDGGDVQMDGRSACRQVGGERIGCNERVK